jgi:hypothetical protein
VPAGVVVECERSDLLCADVSDFHPRTLACNPRCYGERKGSKGRTCKSLCKALRISVGMRVGLKSSSRSESCAKGIVDYREVVSAEEVGVKVETGRNFRRGWGRR